MNFSPQPAETARPGSQPPLTVMLVDDDDVAVEGVQRAFAKYRTPWNIITAGDGEEALDIMRGRHACKRIEQPYLVLLDLNMPRMDGFTFLDRIRADAELRATVVFVLTTSSRDLDRAQAYAGSIAGYMVKSAVGPQFAKLAVLLDSYAGAVRLPEPHL